MSKVIRVPFGDRTLPYLPLQLAYQGRQVEVVGMLDTGATVNVLPYDLGAELGLRWESCTAVLELAGNLREVEARGVLVEATIGDLPKVRLAFAWARTSDVPVILGHINFFREFEVCFYGADSYFELSAKGDDK
jgi:Aspartyl protease